MNAFEEFMVQQQSRRLTEPTLLCFGGVLVCVHFAETISCHRFLVAVFVCASLFFGQWIRVTHFLYAQTHRRRRRRRRRQRWKINKSTSWEFNRPLLLIHIDDTYTYVAAAAAAAPPPPAANALLTRGVLRTLSPCICIASAECTMHEGSASVEVSVSFRIYGCPCPEYIFNILIFDTDLVPANNNNTHYSIPTTNYVVVTLVHRTFRRRSFANYSLVMLAFDDDSIK